MLKVQVYVLRPHTVRTSSIYLRQIGSDTIGWNYSPTSKDNEAISLAYQDVDVELFSPAFLRPETVPVETFANGTSGPTNETTLGTYSIEWIEVDPELTVSEMIFSVASQAGTTGSTIRSQTSNLNRAGPSSLLS